ncbi:unnamed protein product [Didymodactylos carnosus]|uniref:Uncharacterized protein n=1 Tax=Didymodactylos carnosus TaxID=1234261 RepID=A0A813XE40_9BILA|nr:unnamed protein product [Didymodactylos carnosus]CAF3651071.1 unnamed protein product [Didymodactylos carnosus]CAF3823757.1 unnamed protein product [Didymodactylos carnosus]
MFLVIEIHFSLCLYMFFIFLSSNLNEIHFRNGMYSLALMDNLNLSHNIIEQINIKWYRESPHTIDLSYNHLKFVCLHGQTTYNLNLSSNYQLTLDNNVQLNLSQLKYIDLSNINFRSFENVNLFHNLTTIRTLILNNNHLDMEILNWNVFHPMSKYLTHLSLYNMSIEQLEGYLDNQKQLLTIDLYKNNIKCDCSLKALVQWLNLTGETYEYFDVLKRAVRIKCNIYEVTADDLCDQTSIRISFLTKYLILFIIAILIFVIIVKLINRFIKRLKQRRNNFYHRV